MPWYRITYKVTVPGKTMHVSSNHPVLYEVVPLSWIESVSVEAPDPKSADRTARRVIKRVQGKNRHLRTRRIVRDRKREKIEARWGA